MLKLVLGGSGSGKTTLLYARIKARAEAGQRSILLVPEQFTSSTEGRIYRELGDALSGMVDSLLKLTNLEQVPRSDRIKLGELLHQAAEDVSPLAAKKGIAILVEASPGTITGSRELLRRALFNLVENAVKYGPDGGQTRLCAELSGADIVITVANQGPCIPPELRERIFEPFFRADTARSRELGGVGLGLALVRAIAEIHGGSVWVEENQAGWNRFLVRLPAVCS